MSEIRKVDVVTILDGPALCKILKFIDYNSLINELKQDTISDIFRVVPYDTVIRALVESQDIPSLTKLSTNGHLYIPDHNILNKANTDEMATFLLEHGLDLNQVTTLNEETRKKVINHIVTKTLKVKMNPNSKHWPNGIPLWRAILSTNYAHENIKLITYKGDNFSEDLDINAVDNLGNTYLHNVGAVKCFINLKPDTNIKNKAGLTALEHNKLIGIEAKLLEEYVASQKKDKVQELEALLDKTEKNLSKSQAELAECKNKLNILTNLLSSP